MGKHVREYTKITSCVHVVWQWLVIISKHLFYKRQIAICPLSMGRSGLWNNSLNMPGRIEKVPFVDQQAIYLILMLSDTID